MPHEKEIGVIGARNPAQTAREPAGIHADHAVEEGDGRPISCGEDHAVEREDRAIVELRSP